ncbi:dynein axonemal heavy chain 10-like [Arctopsyche grandis]|uniref:dynein axonemal heavy chain 10-like n=1 Tax=Arctopsyche grandis TaxID=121162 RepID=UPI00406D6691
MMMKLPKFNGGFGEITENTDLNTKYVYVMRLTETPIETLDSEISARQIMSKNFIVGSCSGKFLKSIWDVLRQPYNEFFDSNSNVNQKLLDGSPTEMLKAEPKNKNKLSCMNFNRYSHYYQLSTRAREMRLKQSIDSEKKKENNPLPDSTSVHAETPEDLQSLINSVEWTFEHTEGVTHLPIPNLPQLSDPKLTANVLANDKDLIETLDETVTSWCTQIANTIEASLIKNMEAEGPLDEFNFWNTHHTSLSNLNEQLNTTLVHYVISILINANSDTVKAFDVQKDKLIKKYLQARENVEFLSTLLQYFTIITKSPNLKEIGNIIPGLIDGLNMLWMLSEFYSKDENMVALLERIAHCLCQKIEVHLSVQTLFLLPYGDVYKLAVNAKNMLEKWKKCYMLTRQKIENSGKGARWEFDRRRLFHRTDYLASVCDDLSKVARVLIQFENIFGTELKSILKDQTEIQKIIKLVQQLVFSIQTVDFSLFIPDNKENWDVIINEFYKDVAIVEDKAKIFIDDSFENLRSSEEAMEMLLKLTNFETRESIHEQLTMKFGVIMQQFMKEITTIQSIFNEHKDDPPLLHNHPPVAGAIFWSRSLCKKLNKSLSLFETVTQLADSEQKIIAFSYYKSLKQTMTDYENKKLNDWVQNSTYVINKSMKKKLLKVVRINNGNHDDNAKKEFSIKESVITLMKSNSEDSLTPTDVINYELYKKNNNKIKLAQIVTLKTQNKNMLKWTPGKNIKKKETTSWRDLQENHLLKDYNLMYSVNFMKELFEIIYETEILEYLVGTDLPLIIRQCAMQKDRLHNELEKLESIVKEYNDLQNKLVSFECQLLRDHLYDVEKHLHPGLERITWTSLGIMDFIKNSSNSTITKNICVY